MRYNAIDTITFTDQDGNQFPVKDIRPLQELDTATSIKVEKGMKFDDVASRREIYGEGTEALSYVLLDHNAEKMVENDFDVSTLKELKIPVIEDV